MTWEDTDLSVHRSAVHARTWVPNIPFTEIHTAIDGAGPLRTAQRYVLDTAERHGYHLPECTQWRRDGPDTWALWGRVE